MAGYSVEVVADGASAQQQLERSPRPQLVLTDVDMPGLSGLELRAWIRHRHGLPVVLMSGRIDLGMPGPGAGFLAKPLSPGRLLDVVRAALAR